MKRRVLYLITVITMLGVFACFCGCGAGGGKKDGVTPDGERIVYLRIVSSGGDRTLTVPKTASGGTAPDLWAAYSVKVDLAAGSSVSLYDNTDKVYSDYIPSDFDGTISVAGEYGFDLQISGDSGVVYVTVPQNPTPSDPDPEPDPEPVDPTPSESTNVTVYYTNSEGWNNVYAYLWNYKTGAAKSAWPGERLSVFGTSGYGEKQYAAEVDYSDYDRIVFNDGGDNKTKDLVVSKAASGYYGRDGIFTMGTENYGKVEYFTLTDAKNLSYIAAKNGKPAASKKISVYTPSDYTPAKKYGVLYMFDSQNLYIAASGAEQHHDNNGSWAVDVAVTNLIKNGGDGVIIVAVDNTDGYRDQELTMSQSFGTLTSLGDPQYGDFRNGKLDMLGDFIKETLMPWVNARYSVDTTREKTGIAGSSSGGLAAYYLGLRDNDLYGYIGAFSPANGLFTSGDWTRFYASKNGFGGGKPDIYVYCGMHDGDLEDMLLPEVKRIKNITGYGIPVTNIIENYVDGGTHGENYWRVAFNEFLSLAR